MQEHGSKSGRSYYPCSGGIVCSAFMTPMATPAVPQYMAAGGYDLKSVLKQSIIPCILFCVVSVFWTMSVIPMF